MVLNSLLTASLLAASALVADATCVRRGSDGSSTSNNGSTSTDSGTSTDAGSSSGSGLVAASYFAGYHIDDGYTVDDIPFEKYTDIKYSFAETTPDGSLDLSKSNPDSIPAFVAKAKENNVKALISVGGWTGSRFFSSNIGSAENRTAFITSLTALAEQYDLDGFDFDFEYPNKQGLGCNAISANDTDNFLTFLQELRATTAGATWYLTAATSLFPWNDAAGNRSADNALAGFVDVLDYFMIMNYDIYGAWASTAGPNAALKSSCDARNIMGSLELGLTAWNAAGVPASKIVLGVPAYGHGFSVAPADAFPNGTAAGLDFYPAQNSSNRFQGSSWDTDPPIDDCGNAQPPSGTYPFWSLITEAGFLTETGEPAANVSYGFDECAGQPNVYDPARQIFVSYDDAKSFALKGQAILDQGLGGFAVFETGGDYKDILLDSIRSATGLA